MFIEKVRSKITYRGPLALYISYYVLFLLSTSLILLSFNLNVGSNIFNQILLIGLAGAAISVSLILYCTQISKNIDATQWQKNASTYYEDEGVFDYTHNGFALMTKSGKALNIRWKDIIKIESGQKEFSNQLKVAFIDLYFSEKKFITVDSSMDGFVLFEKRLKENMRDVWQPVPEKKEAPKSYKSLSNLS